MDVVDPRERYDDLLVTSSHEELSPEEFESATSSEAATVGWLVLGVVFDDDGRVLLVDQDWADGWLVPGGVLEPGETVEETAVREIREETGVEITPIRPRAVDDFTFANEATGETDGWTTVHVEAVAETTTIADDLGLEDEGILDARWFEELPRNVFGGELLADVVERCEQVR